MKKIALTAALLMAFTASAQQAASSGAVNHGTINNVVRSSASVTGTGTSFSAATGTSASSSNATVTTTINPVCGGSCPARSGSFEIKGDSSASNTGTAFNVWTGAGTGSASSTGTSAADASGSANYSGPGQWTNGSGSTASSAGGGVTAAANQGGFFDARTAGDLRITGQVGSRVCTAGTTCGSSTVKEVFGSVSDIKNTTSTVSTGTMTVDGRTLNNASTNGNSTTNVNARAGFGDPI